MSSPSSDAPINFTKEVAWCSPFASISFVSSEWFSGASDVLSIPGSIHRVANLVGQLRGSPGRYFFRSLCKAALPILIKITLQFSCFNCVASLQGLWWLLLPELLE